MALHKNAALGLFATAASLPIVLYTVELAKDSAVKYWKFDWDVRPMAYISAGGITTYLAYTVLITACLMWVSGRMHSRYLRACAFATGLMLGMYSLGLLTRVIGVLPAAQ